MRPRATAARRRSSRRAIVGADGVFVAGNVRELHNVADRFVLGLLEARFKLLKGSQPHARTLSDQVAQFERALIEEVLRRHRGNASAASEALGLPKKTFYDKLHRLNLAAENFR